LLLPEIEEEEEEEEEEERALCATCRKDEGRASWRRRASPGGRTKKTTV
jgi:hypothetical protein